jgi:hypothetical protein
VTEHLPTIYEALSSILSITKKERKEATNQPNKKTRQTDRKEN